MHACKLAWARECPTPARRARLQSGHEFGLASPAPSPIIALPDERAKNNTMNMNRKINPAVFWAVLVVGLSTVALCAKLLVGESGNRPHCKTCTCRLLKDSQAANDFTPTPVCPVATGPTNEADAMQLASRSPSALFGMVASHLWGTGSSNYTMGTVLCAVGKKGILPVFYGTNGVGFLPGTLER